jgi:hypothetical protein
MENRKLQLLLHPLFIIALVCLLLNDLYWKYEYHNWLTGKLSDFTGLFVLSVFLSAFFCRHELLIYCGAALFFIWWKTPLSQPAIDLLNQSFSLTLHRTIDYTDYLAIPAIFAPHFLTVPDHKFTLKRKAAVYFISAVCLVAFCSTSMIRKFYIEPEMNSRINYDKVYPTSFGLEQIFDKLDSLGLDYKIDSFTTVPVRLHGGSLLIRSNDSAEKNMIVIEPRGDSSAYFRIDEEPYIAIYNLKVKEDVIPQINIEVKPFVRTSDIYVKSIVLNEQQLDEYYKKRSKTKKKLRKLFEEGLIRKLQIGPQ